jgi:hypothetical protein
MFEKMDQDSILRSYYNIRELYLLQMRQNLCDDSKRHLHRGLLIRLGMMEECIIILNEELNKAHSPLDGYLSMQLTLFLNAYYLNLAGSLDNIAWALVYHHSLINNIDEDEPKHRRFAQHLGKDFLAEIRKKHLDQLSDGLETFRDWYWDMREFRDPAAHRIPLSVPRSVHSEEDVKEYYRLDKEAAELIAQGEEARGMDLIHQSYRLGKHMPIFVSETSKIKLYDLAGRINLDHRN